MTPWFHGIIPWHHDTTPWHHGTISWPWYYTMSPRDHTMGFAGPLEMVFFGPRIDQAPACREFKNEQEDFMGSIVLI